ncbi:dCMP deaminase [Candidatus Woesearchaeota archaeon]|nr:dCMP deaminase [Candidatus Woesearchaeota archaeon]
MDDKFYMKLAIEEAKKCPPSETAYSVGCVIVNVSGEIIARCYSREVDDKVHAEEGALAKLNGKAKDCVIYSTMEPCSVRKSRPKSCTQHIIDSGAKKVVYGLKEPIHFVADCKGHELLEQAGIEVVYFKELEEECLEMNKHLGD